MFFKQLENDKYFQTLFLDMPSWTEFELHHVHLDLQNNSVKLILHTSLVPQKLATPDVNFSAFEIQYFFIKNFSFNQKALAPILLKFVYDPIHKTIEGSSENQLILSFQTEGQKLERWSVFQREV